MVGVLDIDGANYGEFDETDEQELTDLLREINEIGHFRWFSQHI